MWTKEIRKLSDRSLMAKLRRQKLRRKMIKERLKNVKAELIMRQNIIKELEKEMERRK